MSVTAEPAFGLAGATSSTPLLSVENLSVVFRSGAGSVRAIEDVSFEVQQGQVLGIVGESGSGKSVTALSLLRLISRDLAEISSGSVWFGGRDLVQLPERELRKVRGREIGMIFQEPMTSLNPIASIGNQLREPLRLLLGMSFADATRRAEELLDLVGIPQPRKRMAQYPHELSGGMRQRVMIAMALSCEPKLLIADEPTTALDVTTQAQILDLLRSLQSRLGLSIILITHDLGVIAQFADRVQVMYAGRAIEQAAVAEIFRQPAHPYTERLLRIVADLETECDRLTSIEGTVPPPHELPPGCAFAPRCPHADKACTATRPALSAVSADRRCACVRPLGFPQFGGEA
ncbi:MAG: ABC transporter ATP-binding protein [Bradyrhizobium sp.]